MNHRKSKSLKSVHPIVSKLNTSKGVDTHFVVNFSPSVRISKHPVLKGIGSLGTFGSRISDYKAYLRSNNAKDTANDWMCVGMSIKVSMSQINKELF